MSRANIALIHLLLLTPIGLAACGGDASSGVDSTDSAPAAESAEIQRPISVSVAVIAVGESRAQFKAWGTVHPVRRAVLTSELSGRVARRRVDLGDAVSRGQVMLEIDPELHVARVNEAKAKSESARLTAEKGEKDRNRYRTLFEQGNVSDTELETAETRAAEATAVYAGAKAALAQANKDLAAAVVRAPFAGHVAQRPPDRGTTVSPGTPLVTVVSLHQVRVDALVSEQDLPAVRLGAPVSVRVEGAPGGEFTGEVTAIGPQADADSRQFPVEILVTNPEGHPLKGGMVAQVRVIYREYTNVPLIPVDAVREDDEMIYLFVVRNGTAYRTPIEAGPRMGQMLAALSGVAAGDSVVVLGQDRLADNYPVRVEEIQQ